MSAQKILVAWEKLAWVDVGWVLCEAVAEEAVAAMVPHSSLAAEAALVHSHGSA